METIPNIKNIATTIAGILGFISLLGATVLGVLSQYPTVHVPIFIIITLGVCGAVSVFLIGYFNGKNPNGTNKTPIQVQQQNAQQKETVGIVPEVTPTT